MSELSSTQFKFDGVIIRKSTIEINGEEIKNNLKVHFTQTSVVSEDDDKNMQYILGADITTDNNAVKISVEAVGLFKFGDNLTAEQKKKFESINAPSIMFPYLRAYITALSSLSGINPIVLPTLNLSQRTNQ